MKLPLLLLASLSMPLGAVPLHKCVGENGIASYQNVPCTQGEATAWVRDTEPEVVTASAVAAAAAKPRAGRQARAAPARLPPKPASSRCAAEREAAEELRDRQWNRLSFKQRSDLDARVARACRRR